MAQLTLEVSPKVATGMQPVQHRLADVLMLGLHRSSSGHNALSEEIINFLASGPTRQAIIDFRPSEEVVERVYDLLHKNQESTLSVEEAVELDEYARLDYLMTLIKARAQLHHSQFA